MHTDRDACLRAIRAKDARFDGRFYTGVLTTGIYCRPSCPARTPAPGNVRFFPTAAAAQLAGFRACKRCLPGAVPGSPDWDTRGDALARAVRLIDDGVVDRDGVPGLARHLGYSTRQVQRLLIDGAGAGPLALARARRAQTARTLLEATDLPHADIAFAAGFNSVRSFNATMQEVYATTPRELRSRSTRRRGVVDGGLTFIDLDLAARQPFCPCNVFGHLIATAINGVEAFHDGVYHRTLRLPVGYAVVSLAPSGIGASARIGLSDLSQLPTVVARVRRLLDLDADPVAVDAFLSSDPTFTILTAAHPGRRIPRGVDGDEMAVRVLLGQQVSTTAARTHGSRLVAAVGEPVNTPIAGLTHLFPTAEQVLGASDEVFAFPTARRDTIRRVALALADGSLDLGVGVDRDEARARLAAIKGIGPWTVEMVAMRGLGDPDAFPSTDLGLIRAAERLGVGDLAARSRAWRPWRSYATQHLWSLTPHAVNTIPGRRGCSEEEA
ncbi:DNA-3-methyladenine glycosylase II [Tessaracoccus bendigoensis DSM 12906]|uniref:DNA-3-methyladenine glycosylase II n=1 Tax=Tessaracoccus bendigoensis DSM 12906 TaxID=1123357 RepID=A0A1M6JEF5_9ACTN|nr:Ada metal-binding domain-containing protein [Tessaracoccus bendigoensis]SHJ45024.1 DNA-3-methyladenine glycosylase II [Tessaracoccus bendigoensis DSM 12906]